ncbi:MAG TPA: hypothetical protein VD993_16005 [Chitinophagaceae bacterium]|nr:hypothetical protein [Chitinophagaceae bacterium]
MNINRYNYEEFFLLYVDNELTAAERAAVEAFVQENPDLEEELVMLKQSSLRPDMSVKFPGKSSLMKPEAAELVTETNYEEFFLLYVDDELETLLRREVEQFAASKPQYRQELNLLLQTKLETPISIVFPDKSLLYKESDKERKPVIMMWWRVAAIAAMVLLALGIFWINNNKTVDQPGTVAVNKKQNDQPAVTKQPVETLNKQEAQSNDQEAPEYKAPVNNQQLATNDKKKQQQQSVVNNIEPDNQNQGLAVNTLQTNPQEETGLPIESATVTAGVNNIKNISTGMEKANPSSGIEVIPAAYVGSTIPDTEEDVYIANTSVERKNKLRGLFRKVTRVFEKTTNLPAVEEKGLLIGNFEIALK